MLIDRVDLERDVLIVAEIGNNHEGSYSRAEELVGRAAEAGAHAVKFQTFIPEHYISRDSGERLERLRKFALTVQQFASLAQLANRLGLVFFSTPLDLRSADALNEFCPLFKIASGDNNFIPLLERVASFRKPIFLSTGLAGLSDLDTARNMIARVWNEKSYPGEMVLLHCVTSYPTAPGEANLGAIRTLQRHFGGTVGYSDHTIGIDAAVLSVALGARVIEKHFTTDKNFSDFRDHQLSADPAEFRELVERVKLANQMLGSGAKEMQSSERKIHDEVRRSISVAVNLPAGTVLQPEHLIWVRPGTGFAPGSEASVLGRKLRRAVLQGEVLRPEDVA
jgi:N,N'-diacetyllegionaminate synthase